jgi:hypothetical protein
MARAGRTASSRENFIMIDDYYMWFGLCYKCEKVKLFVKLMKRETGGTEYACTYTSMKDVAMLTFVFGLAMPRT